jgi:hypothetical protein
MMIGTRNDVQGKRQKRKDRTRQDKTGKARKSHVVLLSLTYV